MKNELLLEINKHTDTLFEQTKTKPQGTLEFKLNKELEIFPFSTSINFSDEGKWVLKVTSFEATTSVFIINHKNNSFSTLTLNYWTPEGDDEVIH